MANPIQSPVDPEFLTPVKPGNEYPVASILNAIMLSDNISLVRVSDSLDEYWALASGSEAATVIARARYAGYNNWFGVIQGTEDGIEDFQPLVSLSIVGKGGTQTALPPDLIGDFRLAIRTPQGQIWSSRAIDNDDALDHMVTWVDTIDPTHYFVAFEDLSMPESDGDFNDIVLELRHVLDGPVNPAPEPATVFLTAIGLAGLGYARRHKARGLHG